MAAEAPSNSDIDFELIQWGDDAVPEIEADRHVNRPTFDNREHVLGENMIRAFLDHLVQIKQPIDPRVVAAVRTAFDVLTQEIDWHDVPYRVFLRQICREFRIGPQELTAKYSDRVRVTSPYDCYDWVNF